MIQLVENIKIHISVSQALEEVLKSRFHLLQLSKNELFLREGQYNVSLAYIQKGAIRCYHLKDGKDLTNEFFFEDTFITDFSSFTSYQPSRLNFGALESTKLLVISADQLFSLTPEYPEIREWGAKMAEKLFNDSMNRQRLIKSQSIEERYTSILEHEPQILQRVPLHHVASYLGITQVHLSRIRKKIG